MKPQRIIKLQGENVLRLEAFSCEPNGAPIVLVEGKNGSGKTSILRTIEMALAGGKKIPEIPIHKGEARAQIILETNDLIVKRTFTQKGTALTVEGKDGSRHARPQEMLDGLIGSLSFDPLAFAEADKKTQVQMFKEALGLQKRFDELDAKRAFLYEKRHDQNSAVRALQATLDKLPSKHEVPAEAVDVGFLLSELNKEGQTKADNEKKRAGATLLSAQIKQADGAIQRKNLELIRLQKECDEMISERAALITKKRTAQQEIDALIDPDPAKIQGIQDRIAEASKVNEKISANKKRAEYEAELAQAQKQAENYDQDIAAIDKEKVNLIGQCKLPVKGLTFDETGVRLDGLPLEQLSKALQMRISCAIGFALNPNLRVMTIKDGSLLDSEAMQIVHDLAEENEAQIWIERVGENADVKIIIIDGGENGSSGN